jgi:nicotinate-nucleotide pyrophosphorylase (carboxylating)
VTNALVRKKIREMLAEDLGFADVTSEALVPARAIARAEIVARQSGILAGVEEATFAFEELGVHVKVMKAEGENIKVGDVLMRLEGQARSIFAAERVALNLLMRMSGVATATRKMLELAREVNPKVVVAATRKTLPLFSYFDKRAVRVGGGDPHRFGLDDCVLIKSPHVKLTGSVNEAVKRARRTSFTKKIEIEVRSAKDALEASRFGADIVMLDNVPPAEVKRTIELLERAGLRERVLVEASGGIEPSNVVSYAATGVDIVSSSYMTFEAPALDINLGILSKGFKPAPGKKKQKSR